MRIWPLVLLLFAMLVRGSETEPAKTPAESGGNQAQPQTPDAETGQETLTLKGHSSFVYSVSFSPHGKRIASGSDDKTVKVWDALLFGTAGVNAIGDDEKPKRPFGLQQRVRWSTSRVVGSPDPPSPYAVERAFPQLEFPKATVLTRAPGSDRLFVSTRDGRVFSFPNDRDARKAELLLDTGREVYGLAFHPDFATNGYLFAFIRLRKPKPSRTRIARFRALVRADNPLRADPASEQIVLEFSSSGHDGGCLKFGRDGYLYIGTGDGGGSNDVHNTGQFLGDLLASILRIDVDGRHSAKLYAIPPDNPFVNTPGARGEVWAYGFRQPWKFSFDRRTGELWVGDVGQDLWEMIYRVKRGGNYGWSITEGPQPFRPNRRRGPTPIEPPVISHQHGESRSITGGFVYRGKRLPELRGAYLYADYETGKIWGLRYDGGKVTWQRELADTTLDIAAFGEDHAGKLFLLTHEEGRIFRLIRAPKRPKTSKPFPRRLSETGLFASTKDHTPAAGVIGYSVVAPLWSDRAAKERFLALPGDAKIEYRDDRGWLFPDGAVLVKTFSLDTEPGNPASRRRLETRIFTRQLGQWAGYTYVWNDEQTDAELLGRNSLRKVFEITDPTAPGGRRKQTWHFPSRAECMICHNEKAHWVLGLRTLQMNRDHNYGGVTDNQLRTLEHIGLFAKPLPKRPEQLPRFIDPADDTAPLDGRARSYLHANCAHCHRNKGGGNSDFSLLFRLPLAETNTVNVNPLHGTMKIAEARLIAPADPKRSLIYRRMAKPGSGRMPHISSLEVDAAAVRLIQRWIERLGPDANPTKR